jgi:hypothetical protein
MAGRTQPDIDRAVKVMLAQWLGAGRGLHRHRRRGTDDDRTDLGRWRQRA